MTEESTTAITIPPRIFFFDTRPVRTIVKEDGTIWWVAKDACDILGLTNSRMAVAALPDRDKGTVSLADGTSGNPNHTIINEPGLYRLVMRSDKPEALAFQDWIFYEVLPAIRQTGQYQQGGRRVPMIDGLRDIYTELSAAVDMARLFGIQDNAAILAGNRAVQQMYGYDPAGMMGVTHLLQPEQERILTATEIGNELGLSPVGANNLLAEFGLQVQQRDHKNRAYWSMTEQGQRYGRLFDTNKSHGNGTPVLQLKWLASVLEVLRARI